MLRLILFCTGIRYVNLHVSFGEGYKELHTKHMPLPPKGIAKADRETQKYEDKIVFTNAVQKYRHPSLC